MKKNPSTISKPLVSIIINCFNGEKYLEQAIKSIISQTYENWEIIFWDNQSSDNSSKIILSYKDNRIKYYLSSKFNKLYHSRNLAYERASGDLVAFLDTDDYWFQNYLENQVKLFQDPDVGFSCANFFYLYQGFKKKIAFSKKKKSGYVLDDLLKNYSVPLVTLIFRKSLFLNKKLIFDSDYDYIGDFDFVIKISSISKLMRTDFPLAVYRVHANNMSRYNHGQQIQELESWKTKQIYSDYVSSNKNFKWVNVKINYMKAIKLIFENNRVLAFKLSYNLPFSIMKLKILIALFLPLIILKKLFLFR